MTAKIASPQTEEQEIQQPQTTVKEPTGTVMRLLLAATAPLFKRAISSAFAIRLGSPPERDELDEELSKPGVEEELLAQPAKGPDVKRFDVHQRIQHVLMFTSFITLAVTGLPQKFHTFGPSQWLIASLGGIEMTQHIHHIAAYVMLFDCLYHGAYIVHGIFMKKDINPFRMIPSPKDVADAIQMFLYFFGVAKKPPKFDRYSYLEKFDYWAVFWGIAIIGGSGIVLLFPVQITKVLPGPIIPVALAAHSDEALLAIGWIFVVHLFYAHLVPHIFPMNTSIFTGKVPRERYREEHYLDYRRILLAERRQEIQKEGGPSATLPVAGGAPEEAPETAPDTAADAATDAAVDAATDHAPAAEDGPAN